MRIPQFVEAVLNQFEDRTEPVREAAVYDALIGGRRAHGELSEDESRGFQSEAAAFFFYGRPDRDSPWGTHFAPTFTGTREDGSVVHSPDVKELDGETVSHWEARARVSRHPVLRARYADLVWDLKHVITNQKPDVEFARMAIDAYLEATERGLYKMAIEGIRWCERALDLALSITEKERILRVVNFMFDLYDRVATPQCAGTCFFLYDNLDGRGT